MYFKKKILLILVCIFVIASPAFSGDWMQWRGPSFNGSAEETGLPGKWTIKENVSWSTKLPGTGSGTPIICNGRVFISSTDQASKDLLGMCFDAKTGKQLWSKKQKLSSQRIACWL